MKKRNILLGVLTGFATLATLVSCGSKKNNNNKETTTTSTTITSTSTSSTSEESQTTGKATADPFHDDYIVTRDEFIDAVKNIDKQPQEMGYNYAEVQYYIVNNGSISNGTWSFTYDEDTEKWVGSDAAAKEAQDENCILNYNITSRVGNPFATLTFYVDSYALYPYGIEEESDTYTSNFMWDSNGIIAGFGCTGWFWGDSATFTYSWSK